MSRFENLEFGREKEDLENTVRAALKDEAFYYKEATQLFERGQFEKALRAYAKVLEFNPKNNQAWLGQVRMLIELVEWEEGKVWVEKALSLFPDEPELLAAKGVALARSGDPGGALSYSDAAIESQGNTPYIWLARADVLLARKEKRADYCLQKAIELASRHWFVLWLAARIEAYYERFARSLTLVQQGISIDSARAVLWLQAGECQFALGLAAQANRSMEQAREMDPECDIPRLYQQTARSGFLDKVAARWRHWRQK